MNAVAITTTDNPYNPITQFEEWFRFDMDMGYNSCAYLDRVSHTTDDMTDEESEKEIERAIDEIVRLDPFNIYKKVKI